MGGQHKEMIHAQTMVRENWGLKFSKDSSDTGFTAQNKKPKQEPSEDTATQGHLPIDAYTRCHFIVMEAIWHHLFSQQSLCI